MNLIVLIVYIVILGLIVYGVRTYAPIPNGFKVLTYIVCFVVALALVLNAFGLNLYVPPIHHVR